MTVQRDPPRGRRATIDDYEEQDVDVGRYWSRIKLRWWLPVGGLIAGALIGVLLAAGGNKVYTAEAIVYLGTPFTPNGTVQVPALALQPNVVNTTVHSANVITQAAAQSGMSESAIRNGISVRTIGAAKKTGTGTGTNSMLGISVQGSNRPRTEGAANALATLTIKDIAPYVDSKVTLIKNQLTTLDRERDAVKLQIAVANRALAQGKNLPPLDQLTLATVVNNAEERLATIETNILDNQQLLNLADQVESPYVYQKAVAVPSTARSKRNSLLAGGLLGLVIGLIVAILWDPVAERRRPHPA
jgi:hypothetical protein